ncbi:hypothetical protein J3458_005191 [Metarhizium acridum]|uniref:uncharacterized protein n=1 Tax=Metarhizium acridum TaxID=92637 RepID=UPI001C6B3F53|nr:hypothetical protein J3458_005191 [Metarhizium acridum]
MSSLSSGPRYSPYQKRPVSLLSLNSLAQPELFHWALLLRHQFPFFAFACALQLHKSVTAAAHATEFGPHLPQRCGQEKSVQRRRTYVQLHAWVRETSHISASLSSEACGVRMVALQKMASRSLEPL